MAGFLTDDSAVDRPTHPVAVGGSGSGAGSRGGGRGQWAVYQLGSAVDVMYTSPEGRVFGYIEPVDAPGDACNVRQATDVATYEIQRRVQAAPHVTYVAPSDDNTTTHEGQHTTTDG